MSEAQRYRRRPTIAEAMQWTGDNLADVQAFVGIMANMDGDVATVRFLEPEARDVDGERIWNNGSAHLWVEANHKWVPVPRGQWVIKDSAGFYPCMADIFAATYEPVSSIQGENQ